MSFVGNWKFHSIATMNDDGVVYLTAQEYLDSTMPYIDENDEEAVADELKERRGMINMKLKVCDDGKLYCLMPLPEGVTQEEVDAAVKEGQITLMDGMICGEPMEWEDRDGQLWFNSGIEGEFMGEKADPWLNASQDEGFVTFMTTRFVKED